MRLTVIDDEHDRFRDACGVVGVSGHQEAANIAYLGLYALQHRGQESAGIVAGDGAHFVRKVDAGLVADVFDEPALRALPGDFAVGHVRYATAGEENEHVRDAQPLLVRCGIGQFCVAHNGNLINYRALRDELEQAGSIFQTTSDTEVICHLMARAHGDLVERLKAALSRVQGAFSLVVAGTGLLIGVRDPSGVRPLVLGTLDDGHILASETCAFDLVGASRVRDVAPGEMVVVDGQDVRTDRLDNPDGLPVANCVFEHVYFARPDSLVFGRPVHVARKEMGRVLAAEHPIDADVVIPVPDSGFFAAMGYAEASGIPFDMGLVRNHYVGRTFIEPEQGIRNFGVRLKLNPAAHLMNDKRVIVVDDSIVRGTTSRKIVELIRRAGAKAVHMRISAPPTIGPCHYGVDTPSEKELIAAQKSVEEIRTHIGADSLGYLSLEGLSRAMAVARGEGPETTFCHACFSRRYPIPLAP